VDLGPKIDAASAGMSSYSALSAISLPQLQNAVHEMMRRMQLPAP
jgi:hypothetical protein